MTIEKINSQQPKTKNNLPKDYLLQPTCYVVYIFITSFFPISKTQTSIHNYIREIIIKKIIYKI